MRISTLFKALEKTKVLWNLRRLKNTLDRKSEENIYISFIRQFLEHCDAIWSNCASSKKDHLE